MNNNSGPSCITWPDFVDHNLIPVGGPLRESCELELKTLMQSIRAVVWERQGNFERMFWKLFCHYKKTCEESDRQKVFLREYSDEIKQLEKTVQDLVSENNSSARSQVVSLQNEVASIVKDIQDEERSKQLTVSDLKTQVLKLQQTVALREETQKMEELADSRQVEDLETKMFSLEDALSQLKSDEEKLKEAHKTRTSKLLSKTPYMRSKLDKLYSSMVSKLQRQEEESQLMEERDKSRVDKIHDLSHRLKQCESDLGQEEDAKCSVDTQLHQLQTQRRNLQHKMQALSSTNVDLNDAITDCERMLQEREAEIARLSSLEREHRVRLGESCNSASHVFSVVTQLQEDAATKETELETLLQQLHCLKTEEEEEEARAAAETKECPKSEKQCVAVQQGGWNKYGKVKGICHMIKTKQACLVGEVTDPPSQSDHRNCDKQLDTMVKKITDQFTQNLEVKSRYYKDIIEDLREKVKTERYYRANNCQKFADQMKDLNQHMRDLYPQLVSAYNSEENAKVLTAHKN